MSGRRVRDFSVGLAGEPVPGPGHVLHDLAMPLGLGVSRQTAFLRKSPAFRCCFHAGITGRSTCRSECMEVMPAEPFRLQQPVGFRYGWVLRPAAPNFIKIIIARMAAPEIPYRGCAAPRRSIRRKCLRAPRDRGCG